MTKIKEANQKRSAIVPSIALFLGIQSMETACAAFFYQPKVPSSMNKFKRSKDE